MFCIYDAVSEGIHQPQHTCRGQKTTAGVLPPLPPFLETMPLFLTCAYSKLARKFGFPWTSRVLPVSTYCLPEEHRNADTHATVSGLAVFWGSELRVLGSCRKDFTHWPSPQLHERFSSRSLSSQRYPRGVALMETCGYLTSACFVRASDM